MSKAELSHTVESFGLVLVPDPLIPGRYQVDWELVKLDDPLNGVVSCGHSTILVQPTENAPSLVLAALFDYIQTVS
jgi:hypothetical protein